MTKKYHDLVPIERNNCNDFTYIKVSDSLCMCKENAVLILHYYSFCLQLQQITGCFVMWFKVFGGMCMNSTNEG